MVMRVKSEEGKVCDYAIGSDHAGFHLKEKIKEYLRSGRKSVHDVGIHTLMNVGTGPIAEKVGRLVFKGKCKKGVLVCGTGIGMAIGANKVFGIRAAVCNNQFSAYYAKRHNDVNVICLGARIVAEELAIACLKTWLKEEFLGKKYAQRLAYLDVTENHSCEETKTVKRENRL